MQQLLEVTESRKSSEFPVVETAVVAGAVAVDSRTPSEFPVVEMAAVAAAAVVVVARWAARLSLAKAEAPGHQLLMLPVALLQSAFAGRKRRRVALLVAVPASVWRCVER